MKTLPKIGLALLGATPFVALAQPSKVPAKAQSSDGVFTIKNDRNGGTATYDTNTGVGRMTKNVVVTQTGEDVIIRAQEATFDRNRNVASAKTALRVETRDSTIVGRDLFVDFNDRKAIITSNVVINSHGKNDGVAPGLRGEAQKKPIRVTCDRVDWDYDIRQAIATGNIVITQGPNRGTCERIVYDEARNIINLLGDVRFVDNKGGTFIGQDILIYLEPGRIVSTGVVARGETSGYDTPTPARPKRAPKAGKTFAPAPEIPPGVLGEIGAPPPLPTARPTATEEPAPTPRPDEVGDEKTAG